MRRVPVLAAVLAATVAAVALPAAASADPYWRGGYGYDRGYDHDGWRDRERWRERQWREHEWREHHRYYGYGGYYAPPYAYARPPVVVYGGPYGY